MRQLKITKNITSRNSEALDRYLTEIAREPMLTPDEEATLAHAIHQGGPAGERARDRLVSANLRFVVSVAKQYQHQGISLTDLINEGNVGLVKAAEKFDETRGFKFISYAVWWIRQSIMEALAVKSRIVRVPLNQVGIAGKVNRATEQFLQEHGRVPSTHELATMTGIDEDLVISAFEANGRSTSIDAPISEDDDNSLADTLSSDDADSRSDSSLDRESMNLFINDLLKEVLNDRERRIITESFGIGRMEKSLEEIADEMGMTRERIRQVKEKALRKIRNSKYAVTLRQYLG
ncbi:MAG TPA: RNA polymerase subunit sigma [Prevotella sp.]|uniref:sigma-70 family RNA polymerase sigma factor n=1 Tax=Hallella absiana TaxID=2925336 RepID=UPI000EC50A95|nr:RNA polymerase sigma factor RpoD/SigA [Hallella absiana]MDD5822085.1 RNA polymerase sigma factor RpoD/SigA [Prevotella sp.]HCJ47675.1 RNA polymerase subunit sigma [Prevotella sp.]